MRKGFRKILIYFSKSGAALALSHQELAGVLDVAFRSTGLPVGMSEGKNPGVKLSFPTALPQGMESRLEAVEVQVEERVTVREVVEGLADVAPEGIGVIGGDALYGAEKWVVCGIFYEVEPAPPAEVVTAFASAERVPIERRGREVDLRGLVSEIVREGDSLRLTILWTERGTARPRDVLAAMGCDPDGFRMTKTGMTFQSSFGERVQRSG